MEMKKWSWAAFPVLVVTIVLFSSQWLIVGPNQIWQKLWLTGREVKTAEVEVAKLKDKLDKLNGLDVAGQKEILERLEGAVPSQKRMELLIWEVSQAASESSVAVERYGVGSGETQQLLEVTLRTADAGRLVNWVNNMERRLPLVKIVSINYKEGRADVTVEQVWKETIVSRAEAADELPDIREKIRDVLEKLSGLREVSFEQSRDAGGTNPNPF